MLRWNRWLLPARGAKAAAVEITEMENAYQAEPMVITGNGLGPNVGSWLLGVFFFFIFKKIKISKIYVHFENFRKYPPVARPRGNRGPVAQATGDRTLM